MGISHQSLRCHKNDISSLTTPRLDVMLRRKFIILTFLSIRQYSLLQYGSAGYSRKRPEPRDYFLTTKSPAYSVSISLFPKVLSALAGVVTIGSPRRLKLVFSRTGTPVAWPKSSMAR